MPRHVWIDETSLLLRSSKPSIKYHIHYTHTAQDTAKAQVIDCCWWLCFFLYAGAGRGERGGGGVGIGSGQRADSRTIQILLSRGNSIVLPAAAATITKHCNFNVFIPRALGGWTPPTRRRSQWSPLISITMARIQRHTSRQCRLEKSLHCRLHSHNTQQSRGSNVACLRMFPLPL